ncbi:hypothetical protein DsansV1_C03g0029221 [Dioscorea sansibarensis]
MATIFFSSAIAVQNPNPNFHLSSRPHLPSRVRFPLRSPSPNRLRVSASFALPPFTNLLFNSANSFSSMLSLLTTQLREVSSSVAPRLLAAFTNHRAEFVLPMTAVLARVVRWLDIFDQVLMVRVLLSWYPNIPWDRQPFNALSDLCDPFLNLFRKIIPRVGAMDVSPLLAFVVLRLIRSLLGAPDPVMY